MHHIKTIVAAIALASTGSANAITLGTVDTNGNSEVVLSVWDDVAQVSYVRGLGVYYNDWKPADVSPEAGMSVTFAADPVFQNLFSNSQASNIYWNVTAADEVEGATVYTDAGILTTLTLGEDPTQINMPNAGTRTAAQNFNIFMNRVNMQLYHCDQGLACTSTDMGDVHYAGDGAWSTNFGGIFQINNAGNLGDALTWAAFYQTGGTGLFGPTSPPANQSDKVRAENSAALGQWLLAADGSLTYSIAEAGGGVPEVPVPAAVWLFGSGLVGLVGIARRRNPQV